MSEVGGIYGESARQILYLQYAAITRLVAADVGVFLHKSRVV